MITINYLEKKYFSGPSNDNDLKETHLHNFIEESKSFISMIRFGIEK